jgi:hypothetical protein
MDKDTDEQEQLHQESPDYAQDSSEDDNTDAPSGKEALTPIDAELSEDQAATQTDSS